MRLARSTTLLLRARADRLHQRARHVHADRELRGRDARHQDRLRRPLRPKCVPISSTNRAMTGSPSWPPRARSRPSFRPRAPRPGAAADHQLRDALPRVRPRLRPERGPQSRRWRCRLKLVRLRRAQRIDRAPPLRRRGIRAPGRVERSCDEASSAGDEQQLRAQKRKVTGPREISPMRVNIRRDGSRVQSVTLGLQSEGGALLIAVRPPKLRPTRRR